MQNQRGKSKMKKTLITLLALGMASAFALTACNNAYGDAPDPAPATQLEADPGLNPGVATLAPDEINLFWSNMFDPATGQVLYNDQVLDVPTPFVNAGAGAIMLPVVAVAEALGYTVVDNGEEVIIAPGSIITAGVNSFARGREAAMELSTAPEMVEGTLFVPWEFFHMVLDHAAFSEDGNVVIVAIEE